MTQHMRAVFPERPECAATPGSPPQILGPSARASPSAIGARVFPSLWDPCLPLSFSCLKNGELIYGCGDARSPVADWRELAHHLKPFFFPSNGLASGPHCTRAVIRELVHVITRVLLSSSDKGRVSALRPGLRGPRVCEASPFSRSLHHQGRSRPSLGGWWGSTGALGLSIPAGSHGGADTAKSVAL